MKTEKALADIQLLGTNIHKLEFNNDFIAYCDNENVKKELDTSCDILEVSYEDDEEVYIGTLALYVDIEITDGEAGGQMIMHLEMHGGFASERAAAMTEQEFTKRLEINGTAALYSIARSIVLSITSQANMGEAVMLPMINVFRLKEN